ncbi:hypothetical protein [Motiliproteus sp. MSK22-1]|uniref:hypothetical protein n=1 Tax=Motiliproteus sp. MSK22-1 TaxID=1897630 RepID=UPI00097807F5|nr:hypothetical protein [Motiliproteus sp. MSK22-1]OMH38111.1 hypothetical protein BGP75_07510 [Motiliproteus sp. MSK22-1]
MVIRKPVYEVLPYTYIAIGIVVVMAMDSPLTYVSGILFYVAGAVVWVMRSAYRRKNSRKHIANRRNSVRFPEAVYEFLPFIYIGLAVLLVVSFSTPLAYIPGVVLAMAGMLVWIIRAIYRSQAGYESVS